MKPRAIVLGGIGLVIATSFTFVALGDRNPAIRSYSTASPSLAVVASLAGIALFAAAALLALEVGRVPTALAVFALGVAWSADLWAGWSGAPALLRNAGMLLIPMFSAAALLVVATVVDRTWTRATAAAVAAAGVAASLALWLVRNPYLDRYCWRDCYDHPFAPFAGVELARTLTNVGLALGAAAGVAAAAICATSLVRAQGRAVLIAGAVLGVVVLVSDVVLLLEPAEDRTRPLYALLFVARGIAVLALAAALCAPILRSRLLRHAILRLASERGGVGAALADALGDPSLRLGYPLSDGGPTVDADGRTIALAGTPARILRENELVALVELAGKPPPTAALSRALTPASRLALANERLRAEELYRLNELAELRRRIVVTGDDARRRLERDLHDGAQQRLLTVSIDLRVALRLAEDSGRAEAAALLRQAGERIADALAELREVAHGIFPTTLTTSGLAAALQTLADHRPVVLVSELEAGRRFPSEIETAAYAIVAACTDAESSAVRVRLEERSGELAVSVEGGAWNGGAESARERVGAIGGTITRAGATVDVSLPIVAG